MRQQRTIHSLINTVSVSRSCLLGVNISNLIKINTVHHNEIPVLCSTSHTSNKHNSNLSHIKPTLPLIDLNNYVFPNLEMQFYSHLYCQWSILQSMRVFSIKIRHGPDRVLSISESVSVLWSLPFVHGVS